MSQSTERPTAKLTQARRVKTRSNARMAWLAGALAIGFVAWFWITSRAPPTPLSLIRDSAGRLVQVSTGEAADSSKNRLSFSAAKIDAKNSVSSSHGSFHSANNAFPCRTVTILNHSDHPLLQRVGALLPDQLSSLNFIDRVDYFPANMGPPVGSQSADLWITLDLGSYQSSGMLPRFTLDAEVVATAGSTLASGAFNSSDRITPPRVGFNWEGTIDHHSTTTGVSSDKLARAAESIAAQLAESLAKPLQELHDKHGPLPDLNDGFFPTYTPTPKSLNFDAWGATQVLSSHGLMFSNETYWRVATTSSVASMIKEAQGRFEKQGWTTRHCTAGENQPHLSMTRNEDRLNIFVRRRAMPREGVTIRIGGEADDLAAEPRTVYVHFLDRLNSQELRDAVDRQLEVGSPLDSILLLSTKLSGDQRMRYLELLENQNPTSSQAWRTLAGEYANSNQEDKARAALRRAYWLAKLDPATGDSTNETKKLAKKLNVEEILKEHPTPELFREFGIAELKLGESTAPVEVALNQPAMFFAIDEKGKWHVLTWRIGAIGPLAQGQRYALAQAYVSGGNSSWGSSRPLQARKTDKREARTIPGLGKVFLAIEVLENETCRFIGTLEPE